VIDGKFAHPGAGELADGVLTGAADSAIGLRGTGGEYLVPPINDVFSSDEIWRI
jgi:hypothetical protein